MSVLIAPLQSMDEIDDVLAIEQVSFTNPWTRSMHETDLANCDVSHVFMARDETGQAIAFCSFWIVLDELHLSISPFVAGSGESLRAGISTTPMNLTGVTDIGNCAVVRAYTPSR